MGFFVKSKFHKNKRHRGSAFKLRKWGTTGLVFVLCLVLLSSQVYAASAGSKHHQDTIDYCMTVHDVSVGLQELNGKSDSAKSAIVESASGYVFYTWFYL